MHYNFVRIHQTLRVTPAMAAGVTDRLWEIGDIIRLLEEREERILAEEREERLLRLYTGITSSRGIARGARRDGDVYQRRCNHYGLYSFPQILGEKIAKPVEKLFKIVENIYLVKCFFSF
jgi:hypothetical protein